MAIVHQVPEGHVGVYWRGGALLKTITEPGEKCFVFSMFFFDVCAHKILVHVFNVNSSRFPYENAFLNSV
jgi:hypothetical protein